MMPAKLWSLVNQYTLLE